jgi:multiple sugar transport system substrate-binding protein
MSSLTTGKPRRTLTSRGIRTAVAVFTAAGMACASVAVGAAAAAPRATHSSAKPIVVWVDAARLTMVKAYEKANPGIKIDTVTFDGGANGSGSIESKVALFNRVGHGWPDIVFSTEQNDVQTLSPLRSISRRRSTTASSRRRSSRITRRARCLRA